MQRSCQKIVRIQDGLITEIYDGLVYRDFSDNENALKELLMDDIGLDFDAVIHTYEKLLYDLAMKSTELRSLIMERLPEEWLDWACDHYEEKEETVASLLKKQPIL
ncbi:hypothetical protein O9H85_10520 [Paenibacillus filicis]|uniref:CdiI immunity protein domain-containing protein n=1 Tax=Paenibacillus gyeongsangnamensis TaxID=3388067 RepID=A0ABT4Q7S2_9BACL|nr:hypothetical protein [Paenibacillus filicis]MCZ8512841.1 hypothetical protein [Paenibacillus filicis]